jgi:hypothetical protein
LRPSGSLGEPAGEIGSNQSTVSPWFFGEIGEIDESSSVAIIAHE